MPRKKHSRIADDRSAGKPAVSETKAQPYGRQRGIRVAANIAIVKRRLKKLVKRSKREIEWALGMVGIGAGPVDLSERAREHLKVARSNCSGARWPFGCPSTTEGSWEGKTSAGCF